MVKCQRALVTTAEGKGNRSLILWQRSELTLFNINTTNNALSSHGVFMESEHSLEFLNTWAKFLAHTHMPSRCAWSVCKLTGICIRLSQLESELLNYVQLSVWEILIVCILSPSILSDGEVMQEENKVLALREFYKHIASAVKFT